MTYHAGDPYRYVDRVKNGVPHYVDTKIRTVHPPTGDQPGMLFLENDQKIEIIQASCDLKGK